MPRHTAMNGTITSFCLESQKSSRNFDMDLEAGIQLIKRKVLHQLECIKPLNNGISTTNLKW